MRRILYPNLCFEDELQNRTSSQSAILAAQELSTVMGLLALESPDVSTTVLITAAAHPGGLPEILNGVRFESIDSAGELIAAGGDIAFLPWGWSQPAVSLARRLGIPHCWPETDAVVHVNRREFHVPFDAWMTHDGTRQPGSFSTLCWTMNEVSNAISDACARGDGGWVIKSSLSHAARNRLLGRGEALSDTAMTWLMRRLDVGDAVAVEPWVLRIAECGLQFHISAGERGPDARAGQGAIEFVGAAELLTHADGRYAGSVIHSDVIDGWWRPAVDHGLTIAAAARDRGFSGHLGIDCMRFRDHTTGADAIRLAHDINGRLTMGRLALALRDCLKPHETGLWLHHDRHFFATETNRPGEWQRRGVVLRATSPQTIGNREPRLLTTLVTGDPDAVRSYWHDVNSGRSPDRGTGVR